MTSNAHWAVFSLDKNAQTMTIVMLHCLCYKPVGYIISVSELYEKWTIFQWVTRVFMKQ